jgi:hypothetical protein
VKLKKFFWADCSWLLWAISAIVVLLFLQGSADARKPQPSDTSITRGQTSTGASYMNGGLTFDEQSAMEARSAPYNLKIVFASRAGTLISSILLMIGNNQNRRIDKIVVRGPWFYIRLPPGGYTILARIKNRIVLIRDVYIYEDGRATYVVGGN